MIPNDLGLRELIEPLGSRAPVSRGQAAAALERSRASWRAFLAGHPAGYTYLRSYSEAPDRIENSFISVRDGRVLEHRCEEWGGPAQSSDGKSRLVADLARCYSPLTVDQLYDRCAEIIDRATSGVVFELHQSGILAACTLPNALCGPSSSACVTLRWVWEPSEERPCVEALRAYPHGSKRKVLCNTCTCSNGGEGCTDAGPDMCLP